VTPVASPVWAGTTYPQTNLERPHGTRDKYSDEKCRCTPCREAFAAYKDKREKLIAAGEWQPFMDAKPVRAHLHKLMAGGLSLRATAALAGVPKSTLQSMMYGAPGHGRAPSKGIDVDTGQRILALSPTLDDYPPRAWIDATGTQRRLQALAVLGWPMTQIAPHAGMAPTYVQRILRGDRVLASTFRAVRAAYDQLWNQQPSTETRAERISVTKTLAHARKNGWVSPLAWNDDEIDDPKARPQGVRCGEEVAA
jgi:hypothetical protein